MKTALLTLFPLLLLVAFTTKRPSLASAEPVLDTQRHPVLPSAQYYVMPQMMGPTGGGLRPGYTMNKTCPLAVLQEHSEVSFGLPLKLQPLQKSSTVPTDTLLEISFAVKLDCVESTKWVIVEEIAEAWSVGIGVAQDHLGNKTLNGSFKIEKFDLGYKFVFCTKLIGCRDIGRHNDDEGHRRLVLNTHRGYPYAVVFRNASL